MANNDNRRSDRSSPIEPMGAQAADTFRTAAIWLGLAATLYVAWQVAAGILVLFAGLIFGIALDGATRMLGKALPFPHWVRLGLVCILIVAFIVIAGALIGTSIADQAEAMSATLAQQLERLRVFGAEYGVRIDGQALRTALLGGAGFGQLTGILGNVAGGLTALALIVVVGVYIAAEPRMYARGLAWLMPRRHRAELNSMFEHMASTMRHWVGGRLLVMAAEGLLSAVALWIAGVPLAGFLGLLSFTLAFVPNIGAAIAGSLMVLVGLSVDMATGLAAFAVYVGVQFVESNVFTPIVERKVVDLAPAVVLAVQLIFGLLFGILGLALADPLVAMFKVGLEHRADRLAEEPEP